MTALHTCVTEGSSRRIDVTIRLVDVWKRFAQGWILKGVSAHFGGGIHIVVGPNGSGKTTLVRIIAGITPPSRGTVEVDGSLSVVFHTPSLYEELTVRENLEFYAELVGDDPSSVWDMFGVRRFLDSRVASLSYGWRRRVDMARAFLGSPNNLVIDEPTTGLDDAAREELKAYLYRISTVLLMSPTVLGWGDESFLVDGRLVK